MYSYTSTGLYGEAHRQKPTAQQSAPKKPEEATAEIARAALFAQLGPEVKFLGEKVDGITEFVSRDFDMVRGKMGILKDENKWMRTELCKTKADVEDMEEENEKFMKRYQKLEQEHEELEQKEEKMEVPFVTQMYLVIDSGETRLNTMSFYKPPSCCNFHFVLDL
jgi:hypothetical protein